MTPKNLCDESSRVLKESSHDGGEDVRETAFKELKESFDILQKMVSSDTADQSLFTGMSKLNKRLKRLSKNQISSALCKFGVPQFQHLNKRVSTTSAVRRAQKNMINVQPASVQRRKRKNGSKKAVRVPGKLSNNLPIPLTQRKRAHNLARNITDGVLPAKKHSKDMKSRFRPNVKKTRNVQKGKKVKEDK